MTRDNAPTQRQRRAKYTGRTGLPLIMARALAPFAPAQSEIHRIVSEAAPISADLEKEVLEQTQILRDSADRLADNGYSATGAEIRMAAKAIEAALAGATS